MANNTVVNFDPADGVRAVVKSEQAVLTSAGADTVKRLTILGRIAADGTFTFTVTSVAAGEATVTFTCGTRTDTTVVTVTDPD
jgi:hypothetical protein